MLDTFGSRAFAVCDHQVAHVYVDPLTTDRERVRELIAATARRRTRPDRRGARARSAWTILARATSWSCRNPTPGSPILTGSMTAWPPISPGPSTSTASPATTPASCSSTPACRGPRVARSARLVQKKLGFRTLFDVIPLDPALVRGSHGVPAARPEDRPVLIGDGPAPSRNGIDPDDRGPRPAAPSTRSRVTRRDSPSLRIESRARRLVDDVDHRRRHNAIGGPTVADRARRWPPSSDPGSA